MILFPLTSIINAAYYSVYFPFYICPLVTFFPQPNIQSFQFYDQLQYQSSMAPNFNSLFSTFEPNECIYSFHLKHYAVNLMQFYSLIFSKFILNKQILFYKIIYYKSIVKQLICFSFIIYQDFGNQLRCISWPIYYRFLFSMAGIISSIILVALFISTFF